MIQTTAVGKDARGSTTIMVEQSYDEVMFELNERWQGGLAQFTRPTFGGGDATPVAINPAHVIMVSSVQ